MAITITLDNRTYDRPDVLEVGLTEEGGQVLLEVVLAPQELTGRGSRLEVKPPPDLETGDRAYAAIPDVGEVSEDARNLAKANNELVAARGRIKDLERDRDHYEAEATRLADWLAKLGSERAIERYLLPDEARELASVLWHYANLDYGRNR